MKTILIADDNWEIRELLKTLINPSYQVLIAENGRDALDILSRHKVDCLITDHDMPFLSGSELIAQIHKQGIYIPRIVLISGFLPSGYVLDELQRMSHGRSDFFAFEKGQEAFGFIERL